MEYLLFRCSKEIPHNRSLKTQVETHKQSDYDADQSNIFLSQPWQERASVFAQDLAPFPESLIAFVNIVEHSGAHHAGDMLRARHTARSATAAEPSAARVMLRMPETARPQRTTARRARRALTKSHNRRRRRWRLRIRLPRMILQRLLEQRIRHRPRRNRRTPRRMIAMHIHIQHGTIRRLGSRARHLLVVVEAHFAAVYYARRGGAGSCGGFVEVVAEAGDAVAGEDAEDVALVVVKLRRGVAAEGEEVFAEEGLDAG